jgi:transposase
MPAISNDLRQRILDAYAEGVHTRQEVADRFMVSLGMVKKLIQQQRHLGSIGNLHHRAGRKRMIAGELEERLKKLVREQPDATLEELRGRLGLECYLSTIHRALERLGESYKKKGRSRRGAGSRGRQG